ncbi:MAG TPA: hypothetical protein VKV06_10935 [Acidimicrobiales bacterium]|nr:hypothetical protein [Acidimicrobiales bacterium]
MSKRRRGGGNRKVAEAKFWGVPLGAAAGGAGPDGSGPVSDGGGSASDGGGSASDGVVEAVDQATPGGGQRTPAEIVQIRPTPDPGALVRSLGPPPLAVDGAVAERHLTAVYEEAVRTATALAAANGLLASGDDDN